MSDYEVTPNGNIVVGRVALSGSRENEEIRKLSEEIVRLGNKKNSDHAAAVARLKEAGDGVGKCASDAVSWCRAIGVDGQSDHFAFLAKKIDEALAAWQRAKEIG